MPGVPRLSSGERVRVRFDPHHVHFFDPVSTMRL
jgi:hypothetical protein